MGRAQGRTFSSSHISKGMLTLLQGYPNLGFLKRQIPTKENNVLNETDLLGQLEEEFISLAIDPLDAAAVEAEPPYTVLIVYQYVVWSATFQVPVFYFTVHETSEPASLGYEKTMSLISHQMDHHYL